MSASTVGGEVAVALEIEMNFDVVETGLGHHQNEPVIVEKHRLVFGDRRFGQRCGIGFFIELGDDHAEGTATIGFGGVKRKTAGRGHREPGVMREKAVAAS